MFLRIGLLIAAAGLAALYDNGSIYEILDWGRTPDLPVYLFYYRLTATQNYRHMLELTLWEPGYATVQWLFATREIDFWWFTLAIKSALLVAYGRLSIVATGSTLAGVMATTLFLVSPIFDGYTENALRQGIAVSCLLLGMADLSERRWVRALIWGGASILFHGSSALFVLAATLAYQRWSFLRIKFLMVATVIVMAAYAYDLWPTLLQPVTNLMEALDIRFARYGNLGGLPYVVGFKPLFLGASLALLGVSFALYRSGPLNLIEAVIIRTALIITCMYMMLSGFPYYDRVASMSWMFVPVMGFIFLRRLFKPTNWRLAHAAYRVQRSG